MSKIFLTIIIFVSEIINLKGQDTVIVNGIDLKRQDTVALMPGTVLSSVWATPDYRRADSPSNFQQSLERWRSKTTHLTLPDNQTVGSATMIFIIKNFARNQRWELQYVTLCPIAVLFQIKSTNPFSAVNIKGNISEIKQSAYSRNTFVVEIPTNDSATFLLDVYTFMGNAPTNLEIYAKPIYPNYIETQLYIYCLLILLLTLYATFELIWRPYQKRKLKELEDLTEKPIF